MPVSPASLQRGQELFSLNCTICHGQGGKGDGAVGAFFTPKPSDLTSTIVQNLPDAQVFLVITQGIGPMPSLAENLEVVDRWDVVNYVHSLKK
jgi:mono/diheme cytochrome c family protein